MIQKNTAKSIGDTMKSMFREMGLEKKINQYKIFELWPDIVGENIAKIAVPEKVVDKILHLKIKSMTWRTELLYQKPQILGKIEEKIGYDIITDIRFYL